MTLAGPLYIELQMSLERNHVPGNIHIVQLLELADPHAVGIPDLGVDDAGLVLKSETLVILAVFGYKRHPLLAQIDVLDAASFVKFLNVSHLV